MHSVKTLEHHWWILDLSSLPEFASVQHSHTWVYMTVGVSWRNLSPLCLCPAPTHQMSSAVFGISEYTKVSCAPWLKCQRDVRRVIQTFSVAFPAESSYLWLTLSSAKSFWHLESKRFLWKVKKLVALRFLCRSFFWWWKYMCQIHFHQVTSILTQADWEFFGIFKKQEFSPIVKLILLQTSLLVYKWQDKLQKKSNRFSTGWMKKLIYLLSFMSVDGIKENLLRDQYYF